MIRGIIIDNSPYPDVTLTFSDEALIGTALLEDKSVNLDFRTEEIIIT
jgi:hypothetical protein